MKKLYILLIVFIASLLFAQPTMKFNKWFKTYIPKKKFRIKEPRKLVKIDRELTLVFFAVRFAQGEPVYIEIRKSWKHRNKKINRVRFYFDGKYYPLNKYKNGAYGLFPIKPFNRTGYRKIIIKCLLNGKYLKKYFWLKVRKTWYKKYTGHLNIGKFSDANYYKKHRAFIRRSTIKKMMAFRAFTGNYLKQIKSHPRDVHLVTSPFYILRRYYSYKWIRGRKIRQRSNYSPHRGLDLYGRTGDRVYAMAPGRVVLADRLFFEGNMVIINHGNRIFTYYMHLSKLQVSKGQYIRANQVIALAGSTGISTAAHLHVSLMISGIQVNPLHLLSLPLRKYKR